MSYNNIIIFIHPDIHSDKKILIAEDRALQRSHRDLKILIYNNRWQIILGLRHILCIFRAADLLLDNPIFSSLHHRVH